MVFEALISDKQRDRDGMLKSAALTLFGKFVIIKMVTSKKNFSRIELTLLWFGKKEGGMIELVQWNSYIFWVSYLQIGE